MADQWYYSANGQQTGPVDSRKLKQLASDGPLRPDDLVWKDGMKAWVQASSVRGLFPASLESSPTLGSESPPPSKVPSRSGTPMYLVKGVSEELAVYADKLTLTPKGAMGLLVKGLKGTKTIPFQSISALQFKEAGAVFSGYLQFSIPGGNESKGGVFAAAVDENTFMFAGRDNNATVAAVKEFIESTIRQMRGSTATASNSVGDELQKLANLKAQGILSDEEFQAAKRKLIG